MSKTTIGLTILIFLLSLIPQLWFPGRTILIGYDNVYPLSPFPFLIDRVHSWSWLLGFGSDQSAVQGSLLIHFLDSFPQMLGFSDQISQRIIFSFWFFLLLLSSYIFIYVLEKKKFINTPYARYFFPVLYVLNFYTLQAWWIAERTKFSLLVATPLILSVLLPLFKEHITLRLALKKGIFCAAILTVFNGGGWPGFSLFGGLLVLIFSFYMVYGASSLRKRKYNKFFVFNSLFIFFGISFFLFNAYTIFPFLSTTLSQYGNLVERSGGVAGISEWTRYLSENTSIINLLRLQGIPDWYNSTSHPYAGLYLHNPFVIVISFVFPVLLFFSFSLKKIEKKISYFFFISLLLSLFFTAGTHEPLGDIFAFMMAHIPGFVVFRSAIFKFGYGYWFIASFLISLSLSTVTEYISRCFHMEAKKSGVIIFLFFFSLILFYNAPFFVGNFFHVDPHYAASRVEVPAYVPQFSKWWQSKGKNDRILLLPQLNADWSFEIYKWKYLSLNPILANFGDSGIVENSVLLTPDERDLVFALYNAINNKNEKEVDELSSLLGIRYLLLRRDFAYDYPSIQTDRPDEIARKLAAMNITEKKQFGLWQVYAFSSEKPIVTTTSSAYVSDNGLLDSLSSENTVALTSSPIEKIPISKYVAHPNCISCEAERAETSVEFPKPKLLLDSNLYKLISLRDRFLKRKPQTSEDKLFFFAGESLKYASQLKELIEMDKPEMYIELARESYVSTLLSFYRLTQEIPTQSSNPFLTAVRLQDYSKAQIELLNNLVLKSNNKKQQANLEIILGQLGQNDRKLREIMDRRDFNKVKTYSMEAPVAGSYSLEIKKDTIGNIDNPLSMRLKIGDKVLIPVLNDKSFNFGNINLKKGKNRLVLFLPTQKPVLLPAIREEHAGRICYSSTIKGFQYGKVYSLDFVIRNNFDPNFMFFVDNDQGYEPRLLGYFPVSGEELKTQRYVLSPATVGLEKTSKAMRVGFCSPSLNEKLFLDNVRDLSVVELTSPTIIATNFVSLQKTTPPFISVKRSGYEKFSVHIRNASAPYLLAFAVRYSSAWNANVGEHILGNQFQNIWYIDKKRTYDITIEYTLQKYFYYGLTVTVFSIILAFGILRWLQRK